MRRAGAVGVWFEWVGEWVGGWMVDGWVGGWVFLYLCRCRHVRGRLFGRYGPVGGWVVWMSCCTWYTGEEMRCWKRGMGGWVGGWMGHTSNASIKMPPAIGITVKPVVWVGG